MDLIIAFDQFNTRCFCQEETGVPNRFAMAGTAGEGNGTRMLGEKCFYKWATESCQGTPLLINQDGNPNFKRAT